MPCDVAIPCRAQRGVGVRGMPTFWGWSRAAPAPQANVRRRLLRRLSNAVMAFSRRKHGRTGRATSRVPPARVSALLRPSDSLRSRRLRAFVWGAGAARDQPQNVGIPRNPTPLWARHGIATAQGISHDEGNGKASGEGWRTAGGEMVQASPNAWGATGYASHHLSSNRVDHSSASGSPPFPRGGGRDGDGGHATRALLANLVSCAQSP
jgi:hypothetical protein